MRMNKVYTKVTDTLNFFEGHDPVDLAKEYQTPLYIYNERILRQRCPRSEKHGDLPEFCGGLLCKGKLQSGVSAGSKT